MQRQHNMKANLLCIQSKTCNPRGNVFMEDRSRKHQWVMTFCWFFFHVSVQIMLNLCPFLTSVGSPGTPWGSLWAPLGGFGRQKPQNLTFWGFGAPKTWLLENGGARKKTEMRPGQFFGGTNSGGKKYVFWVGFFSLLSLTFGPPKNSKSSVWLK